MSPPGATFGSFRNSNVYCLIVSKYSINANEDTSSRDECGGCLSKSLQRNSKRPLSELLIKESAAVYYLKDDVPNIGKEEIDWLISNAEANGLVRIRFCLHPSKEDAHHDMIIAQHADDYVQPHKHPTKSETHHAVRGSAKYIFFDEAGEIDQITILDERNSIIRVPPNKYHSLIATSDWFVFHESARGPFSQEATTRAPWLGTRDELHNKVATYRL